MIVAMTFATICAPTLGEMLILEPRRDCTLVVEGENDSRLMTIKGEKSSETQCAVYLSKKNFYERFVYCGVGGITITKQAFFEWCYIDYYPREDDYSFVWSTKGNLSCNFTCLVK
jgi:hypothetical protein